MRQKRAHVEQKVRDFGGRDELTGNHLAQTTIDDRQCFVDLVAVVGLRHRGLQPCPPDQHSRSIVTPYRSSVTRAFQAHGDFRHQTGT